MVYNNSTSLSMKPKILCRFKENCNNYLAGTPCNFSHDECKFGKDCKNIANCKYFHPPQNSSSSLSKPQSKFEKPIRQVECKFGIRCQKRMEGKCPFKHSLTSNQSVIPKVEANKSDFSGGGFNRSLNKSQIPCQYGDRCTFFPLGKCPYKHEAPRMMQEPRPSLREEKDLGALESLCLNFLSNKPCNQICAKIHGYSETKTINKIFTVSNCNRQIKKIMILEAYSPDEQPLYIILGQNRVMFSQLTNLAKEGGNESISNNTLVMKRWHDQDIVFGDDYINNSWLVKAEPNPRDRSDILVLKCTSRVRFIVFNKGRMSDFVFPEQIKDAIFLSNILLLLTTTKRLYGFQYNFASSEFKELGIVLNEPLIFIRKYHKQIQEEEIAAGATEEGTLCFINSKLGIHKLELKENIRDVCIAEYQNIPAALTLLQNGRIIGINLLTFESTLLLEGNLPRQLRCSSLTLTLQHLIMAIDGFGVIVYNYQQFNKIIGILNLGPNRWTVSSNQRGNVALISQDSAGRLQANFFKFARL